MRVQRLIVPAMLPALFAFAARAAAPPNTDAFETRIRPVLAKACYSCHTDAAMGGLQLDSREHLLKGGKSGAAIVPGDPDASKLIQAIRYNGARKMPPTGKLKDDEIASLEAWVKAGAVWPAGSKTAPVTAQAPYIITPEQHAFWSFQPVKIRATAGGQGFQVGAHGYRPLHSRQAGSERDETGAVGRPAHADPPRHVGHYGLAADAGRGRGFRGGSLA